MFELMMQILHYSTYLPILKTTTFKAICFSGVIMSIRSFFLFKRKSTFLSDDDDGSTDSELTDTAGGKCCKVTTTVINERAGKVDKTVDVNVVVPDEYDLHDFSRTDQGVISFDGELMIE